MTIQLDLFAESEAAQRDRIFNSAPSIYDTAQLGYFNRQAIFAQWCIDYEHFGSLRRSHAWVNHIALYLDPAPTEQCRPTVLAADLSCGHYDRTVGPCECVGGYVRRGACLHCTWEGPIRRSENGATEDANDHAWPGWRDLPIITRAPDGVAAGHKHHQRWLEKANALYPAGWITSGGPIITRRGGEFGHRHVPNATGYGGYDICLEGLQSDTPPAEPEPGSGGAV